MEVINAIRFGLLIFVVVSVIIAVTASIRRRRQEKLDEIAREALTDFNFNKENEEIKSIGARYVSEKYRCPRCNGMLVKRKGKVEQSPK